MILSAFEEIVAGSDAQVILSSHTPNLVRKVDYTKLRFISKDQDCFPIVESLDEGKDEEILGRINKTLGSYDINMDRIVSCTILSIGK